MEVIVSTIDPVRNRFMITREVDRGEGKILDLLLLPLDALEWRAAEYQIDPKEVDLLMDIVLYETETPQQEDAAPLYMAASIEEARDIHVGRVMATKKRLRPQPNVWMTNAQRLARLRAAGGDTFAEQLRPSITDDALQGIRDNHLMDPDVIEEKKLLVERRRKRAWQRQQGGELMPGGGGLDRRLAAGGPSRADVFRAMRTLGKKGNN